MSLRKSSIRRKISFGKVPEDKFIDIAKQEKEEHQFEDSPEINKDENKLKNLDKLQGINQEINLNFWKNLKLHKAQFNQSSRIRRDEKRQKVIQIRDS